MPPDADTVTVPLIPPQLVGVELMVKTNLVGCVIVIDAEAEQPFLSVAVTEYTPATKLEILEVVAPVFHK